MKATVDYGKSQMQFEAPDFLTMTVLEGAEPEPLSDPHSAVAEALSNPIAARTLSILCRGKRSAAIVITDHTRPLPASLILPELIREIEQAGIERNHITVIIATGLHRPSTEDEIKGFVGPELYGQIKVVSHDARIAESHGEIGVLSSGIPIKVDHAYIAADLKIVVGLVEPHFMAGYSGGRKLILPGIASRENIFAFHSPNILSDPNARSGSLHRNPVHKMAIEAAFLSDVDLSVNVTINHNKQLTGVFIGELDKAHRAAISFGDHFWRVKTAKPADIVVTSAGGAPLDATFYQAIKGAVTANAVCKRGGTIILVSECAEGVGSNEFVRELEYFKNPREYQNIISRRAEPAIDQWQLQKLAETMVTNNIILVSGLSQSITLPIKRAATVEEAILGLVTEKPQLASIHVLPTGPYIIAETDAKA